MERCRVLCRRRAHGHAGLGRPRRRGPGRWRLHRDADRAQRQGGHGAEGQRRGRAVRRDPGRAAVGRQPRPCGRAELELRRRQAGQGRDGHAASAGDGRHRRGRPARARAVGGGGRGLLALHHLLRQLPRPDQRLRRRWRDRQLQLVAAGAKRRLRPRRRLPVCEGRRAGHLRQHRPQPLLRRLVQHQHQRQRHRGQGALPARPADRGGGHRGQPRLPGDVRHGVGRHQQRRPPEHLQQQRAVLVGIQRAERALRRSLHRQERLRDAVLGDARAGPGGAVQPSGLERPVHHQRHRHGLQRRR